VSGPRYRVASQSLWDSAKQRPFARQAVLGPADPPPVADLALTRTVGARRVGDVGTLVWVAEQLDLIKLIDQGCGVTGPSDGPTIGEMVLAVAVQRACAPGGKCHLAVFLESTGRIVYGFRGQWNVEELFRRGKRGGPYPGGHLISGPTVPCDCIRSRR
jgi:hypothetical protein